MMREWGGKIVACLAFICIILLYCSFFKFEFKLKSIVPQINNVYHNTTPQMSVNKNKMPTHDDKPATKPMTTDKPVIKPNITILDWCPVFFTRENGLPVNARFNNCIVTRDKSKLDKSDAVVIEVRNIPNLRDMPPRRQAWQKWVYFNVEAPPFAILDYKGRYTMNDFKGKLAFNWTMTYRTDAHVPMLHGWMVEKTKEEKMATDIASIIKHKQKGVYAMMSNCHFVTNHRLVYVKELQKYISVDVYGGCGTFKCKGHYKMKSCDEVHQYKFFLAFENSNCRDYITEKMWVQGFGKGAVPIVLGAYKEDYLKQVPRHSVIFVEDFKTPRDLAAHLKKLLGNKTAYNEYHEWRKSYKVDLDYRFKGTYAWTTLCRELTKRYNEKPKWYDVITDFESVDKNCFQNEWIKSAV